MEQYAFHVFDSLKWGRETEYGTKADVIRLARRLSRSYPHIYEIFLSKEEVIG
jgi:hypothetical protein